jgi:hypothetical protein
LEEEIRDKLDSDEEGTTHKYCSDINSDKKIYNLETKLNVKEWFSKPPFYVCEKVLDRVII